MGAVGARGRGNLRAKPRTPGRYIGRVALFMHCVVALFTLLVTLPYLATGELKYLAPWPVWLWAAALVFKGITWHLGHVALGIACIGTAWRVRETGDSAAVSTTAIVVNVAAAGAAIAFFVLALGE